MNNIELKDIHGLLIGNTLNNIKDISALEIGVYILSLELENKKRFTTKGLLKNRSFTVRNIIVSFRRDE